jgi:hypothetical protein
MIARMMQLVAVGLVVALVPATALAVDAKKLVGKYTVTGKNPDGSAYEGTAYISYEGAYTVKVKYVYSNKTDVGLGTVKGNVLSVQFQNVSAANIKGSAVYTYNSNGVLAGYWRFKGEKKLSETLIPKK